MIGKLDGCNFVELSIRLNFRYYHDSAAVAFDDGAIALICFPGYSPIESCEIFDLTSATPTHSTQYTHTYGKLGIYQGNPITVGSYYSSGTKKVEVYNPTGWFSMPDHTRNIYAHTLTGLDDGSLILAGGYDMTQDSFSKNIWMLKNGSWDIIGLMKMNYYLASAIRIESEIFIASGRPAENVGNYPVERIIFEDNQFIETNIIASHDSSNYIPVLFAVEIDFCIDESS
ncbi:Oidioi.mRNA.OKI2018_I69.chr1.g532.t1.cds [Oikopleura dioica]|nr:Oidioi.mRNA.OKI2018_I69.chr1.g532.t1.cds [Oikopleura dioica]